MAVAAQMNVRIDSGLKEQGDLILAKRGFSPSQAVRALYEGITGTKERADKVFAAVFGRNTERAEAEAEKAKKLESIRKVQDSIRAMGCVGASPRGSAFDEAAFDKALLEEAVFDHYMEKEASR